MTWIGARVRPLRSGGWLLPMALALLACGCGRAVDRDARQVAEWVIETGGSLYVDQSTLQIRRKEDLPSGDFAIVRIELSGTKVQDADLARLIGLRHLKYLGLHRTKITDKGIEYIVQIPSLEELELSFTQITDKGIQQLPMLSRLKKLYLSNTFCTPEGVESLRQRMPHCTIVFLR